MSRARRVGAVAEVAGQELVLAAQGPHVHDEAAPVRVADERSTARGRVRRRRAAAPGTCAAPMPSAYVAIQARPVGRHQVAVGPRVTGGDEVGGPRRRRRELDERHASIIGVEVAQDRRLEGLDDDRRRSAVEAVALAQRRDAAAPRARGRSSRSRSGAWSRGRRRRPPSRSRRRASSTSSRVGIRSGAVVRRCCRDAPAGSRSLRAQGLAARRGEVLGEPAGHRAAVDDLGGATARRTRDGRATSVVPLISFSWRATSTPSLVETRSGSM